MTHPIVRFAPSPTGRLHVGNVRTALINWLFAHSKGGEFILRIDDTDVERSTTAYEDGLREDLTWLGLIWADTFSQSDRFGEYDKAAARLKEMGLLYACYESADELERKRKIALSRGRPPVYDRASLDLSDDEKTTLEADGVKPHWRFKLSGNRVEWDDLVRGLQSIDTSSLSDPVLIREDGSYLYTMPSVVDDIDAKITHVVRGEDHVTNSGAQIEIFLALGGKAPQMAHTPLLIGADGQGLSKRLGSLSMGELRAQGYEPMAINSLLAKIGTSDNVEARTRLDELAKEFEFGKIGRAPARFDEADLISLNASILHGLPFAAVRDRLAALDSQAADEDFWTVVRQNCSLLPDVTAWVDVVFGDVVPLVAAEDRDFVLQAADLLPASDLTAETWGQWTNAVKAATGRKGKGLFMTLRKALTGQEHGPEMASLLTLIGRTRALARLKAV